MSTKLDIYGYGVVLLEVVTGLKPHVASRDPQNLVEYVASCIEKLGDSEKLEDALADSQCAPTGGELYAV